jgi:chromosome segregation ATPase
MSNLWIPTGNHRQTELDIKISELQSVILRLKSEISSIKREIEEINAILTDVRTAMKHLRRPKVAVSIKEYKYLKFEETLAKLTLKDHSADINKLNKRCEDFTKKVLELQDLRRKSATKILRFPDEKAKRPQD